ncbi:MAG: TolC family outer membrane protein [Magnetococcales bacterium]|nr:TolC family outer membrane protein [Magnetococcales bacterium]
MTLPGFFSRFRWKQRACLTVQSRTVLRAVVLLWSVLAARPVGALSLSEAVATALHLSPVVLAAEKQRLILAEQTRQAFSGYLPNLEVVAAVGNEQTNSPSTRNAGWGSVALPHWERRMALNQTLFDGFNVSSQVKRARANQKAADATCRAVVQTVGMDAIEQFLEVQKQRELLDKIKKFAAVQADFLEKIREWYQGGAGTVAEVWQTESRLALTRSSMATVESQLATAVDAFALMFGAEPTTLEKPPPLAHRLPRSLEEALQEAVQHHPTLLEAQFNQEAAAAGQVAAQSGLWPTIQLSLENSRTNNSSGYEGETDTNAAMLRMNYTLFRGGNDWARSREFAHRSEQSEAQRLQSKQIVQKNVEKSWRVIHELRQRLVSLQKHETVSKQVAEAYHEQFIADQRSLLDVLNAENELFNAQSNRVSGYYALQVEEYRLFANMGLLETLFAGAEEEKPVSPPLPVPTALEEPSQGEGVVVSPSLPVALEPQREPAPAPPLPDAGESQEVDRPAALQDAWLTPATPLLLYPNPPWQKTDDRQATVVTLLPKGTPLRILRNRDGWMQVESAAGIQGWTAGLAVPVVGVPSGMFILPASPDDSDPTQPDPAVPGVP